MPSALDETFMYALHKQRYPVLGAGLWGEVLDAGDCVIKFSKRRCAGLGDGLIKVQREADVLREIARSPIQSDTAFAQLIDWGTSDTNEGLSKRHTLWLKTTKLPGRYSTSPQEKDIRLLNQSLLRSSTFTNSLSALRSHPYQRLRRACRQKETCLRSCAESVLFVCDRSSFEQSCNFARHGEEATQILAVALTLLVYKPHR